MPLFEYKCKACNHPFEALVSTRTAETTTIRCPECESDQIERLLGLPTAKVVEGSTNATNCRGDGPPCGAPWCGRKG